MPCDKIALLVEVKIDDVDHVADFAHATEGLAGEEGVHFLLRHAADQIGLDNILADIKTFEAEYGGDIWKPAPLLEKLVAEGKSFASLQS